MPSLEDPFNTKTTLETKAGQVSYFSLPKLEASGYPGISRLPFSIKILLENLLRHVNGTSVTKEDVDRLARWAQTEPTEIPFSPARVLLQDFTGVPAVVDLAAMRSAVARLGGDPKRINPLIPVDLVVDHSVQVDAFGSASALQANMQREFERNRERYEFLRWGQQAFHNFRVIPPAAGIVHQVNLEYLATVITTRTSDHGTLAFPDTVLGTDSHTTMINGLGVLGWGVGGIEAEAAMLGQPVSFLMPQVVGVRLLGEIQEGVTATDVVLTVTQMLRQHNVVDKFVEFFGPGVSRLSLADRATIANMAPEYGATVGFFPVDQETLRYLYETGRDEAMIDLVERYTKSQGMFLSDDAPEPLFSETLELDMSTIESSLAGPKRPQDRIPLSEVKKIFLQEFPLSRVPDSPTELEDGSVVIAAITSCTNTSNPSVMIAAGLLAKKALERGLRVPAHVKTSLAPGSRVVTRYLETSGLLPYLEQLGFHVVGYGCTTCIGNSGPLSPDVEAQIKDRDLTVASVLSGNRNFEGRIHPLTKANFLASPPLVVAFAIAGRVLVDVKTEPLGNDANGQPVYLRDLWPTSKEIQDTVSQSLSRDLFRDQYANIFHGNETWNQIKVPEGALYAWDDASTYIKEPPYFRNKKEPSRHGGLIQSARVLVFLGDSTTTDHISPAGDIARQSAAAAYLHEQNVAPGDFNSYGARRGNHEVMMRGAFANVRLKNKLAPGCVGGITTYLPTGEQISVFDAAVRYQENGTPLIVLAGKDYGMGSSRDWAAKGPALLGVGAVMAESFERIHRSNLIGMGILPLQFLPGETAPSHGLTGEEYFNLTLPVTLQPKQKIRVGVQAHGQKKSFEVLCRLDTPMEIVYFQRGGILPYVFRTLT